MRRSSHYAAAVSILAAGWLLLGCSAKPPEARAEASQEAPENPSLPEAVGDQAPPQIDDTILVDTTVPPPLIVATTNFVSDRSTRRSLRWNFAVDDVIRYQTSLIEIESLDGQEYHNERTVQFQWTVLDVGPEGDATLHVVVERVILNLERPLLHYDTSDRQRSSEPPIDKRTQHEIEAARTLLLTDLTVETTACGEVTAVVGSELITGHWRCLSLTAADFPVLPKEAVGLEDSWCVPLNASGAVVHPVGQMDGRLLREQSIGGRDVRVIECETTVRGEVAPTQTETVRPNGSSTVGRFDRDFGLFLSRTSNGTYSITMDNGQPMQQSYQAKQQLIPTTDDKPRSPQVLIEKWFSQPAQVPSGSTDTAPASATEMEKAAGKRRGPVER